MTVPHETPDSIKEFLTGYNYQTHHYNGKEILILDIVNGKCIESVCFSGSWVEIEGMVRKEFKKKTIETHEYKRL